MKEWCLEHYWMTFIIVYVVVISARLLINNILNIINNKTKVKLVSELCKVEGVSIDDIDKVMKED